LHAVDSIAEQNRATILRLAEGVYKNPGKNSDNEHCGKKQCSAVPITTVQSRVTRFSHSAQTGQKRVIMISPHAGGLCGVVVRSQENRDGQTGIALSWR